MDFDLTGHRALVTGSSRGIGSTVAIELAKHGADIYVHCRKNVTKAEDVCKEIRQLGRRCDVMVADLSNQEEAKKLACSAQDADILILNASVQIQKPWKEITVEDYFTQMNCNYLASLLLIQGMVGTMEQKRWGRIITIGSVQESKPHREMLIYSSSKCAQMGLVRSLAGQLAPMGITVNDVAPGVIRTDRNTAALENREYADYVISTIPAGFYGEKEDVSGIVLTLCSDFGRYITGQCIYVDGGKSL